MNDINKEYRNATRERLNKAVKMYGIKLDFIVISTGIGKTTLYQLTQKTIDKKISKEKLDKINLVLDQIERIINK